MAPSYSQQYNAGKIQEVIVIIVIVLMLVLLLALFFIWMYRVLKKTGLLENEDEWTFNN